MADLLVLQRRELLLRELRATGAVHVAELATRHGVSPGTIRRDLTELAREGHVIKTRGGAVLPRRDAEGRPLSAGRGAGAAPAGLDPRTLGLLVPSATYYYPSVIDGVRSVATRHGARVVISLSRYADPRDLEQVDELLASGASGLLIASAGGTHVTDALVDRLHATGVPFVLLERRTDDHHEACESVVSDHRRGAFGAVRHLHRLGHPRVGLYAYPSPTAPLIRDGHAAAVRQLRLDPAAPVREGRRHPPGSQAAARQYDAFIEDCLASGTRAALVHSDQDAIVLLQRLRARGLRTPQDMALIAYDNELAALAEVPLTAVAPPKEQLGACAAQLLVDRLGEPGGGAVRSVTMQPRLVIRQSCGSAQH
ncbi:substrate-binding domain-containing protein [Streptomyces sp. MP131-18]|uniref:substrate-binding domain-containing protein n=1 Tax=Streptomyces sp. MP131-18 TaxID=1857892 RepID=UPI00097C2433|nr:substrate-binding domain-containing protein [Streptomyces sp. MP131-18]ONK10520.1 Arabinose metabolism transcriptional repressor [Streptomyces sp. MP131-18]